MIIRFLTTDEGGRHSPIYDGYRGQFFYNEWDCDVIQEFPDSQTVGPGDTVRAYISFYDPKFHRKYIHLGMHFSVREGARVVGKGVITKVLKLEESADKR